MEIKGAARWHTSDITYPTAWTQMQGTDNFHLWTFEHIKSGYPELQADLDRLRILEPSIYKDTFVVSNTISEELDNVLKTFHDLSPRIPGMEENYYVRDQVFHAVYGLDDLAETSVPEAPDQKSLSLLGGQEIARCDSATLERLLEEIGKLRTTHRAELEKLKTNAEEHAQLILAIEKKMAEIVQKDIEYLECLKGKCALCERFS